MALPKELATNPLEEVRSIEPELVSLEVYSDLAKDFVEVILLVTDGMSDYLVQRFQNEFDEDSLGKLLGTVSCELSASSFGLTYRFC
jgi:hypothetical protein